MEDEVLQMLEKLGKAVSDGDLKTISASYGYRPSSFPMNR
jgi:hypothetical protein